MLKNPVVFGTLNAGRDTFEASIKDIGEFSKRWPEAVLALIISRFPMTARRDLLTGRAERIRNVIQLN